MVQDKIYQYFERDPELKVLFIFNNEFLAAGLAGLEWRTGYRYVDFKGDWFTVKYNLDNDWQYDKVILMMHQPSPLQVKSLQATFPLMDLLVANMEYHSQDYAAFIQQNGLPDTDKTMIRFIEKNIMQLQSDKMQKLFAPYYQDKSITTDKFIRGFLSSYMGQQRILDWDAIIVRLLLMGRDSERQKQTDFFIKMRGSKDVSDALKQKLTDIFGVSYDENTEAKVCGIVKVLKYNAIVQNLAPMDADNYRQNRINDSLALQQMNRILELALSQEKSAKALMELFDELGADIRDEELIRWYGTEANFYFVPEALCLPIVKTLLEKKIETEPEIVTNRVEDLLLKHNDHGVMAQVMDYALLVARFYQKALSLGSLTLNTPDEYVIRYQEDYYVVDQLYRQSEELYFKVDPSSELFTTIQQVKNNLDQNYAKLCNRMNLEWTRCIKEAGGMKEVHLLRQYDFYEERIKPIQKKVVVIVSDALRYEVAQELIGELAKSRHIATLKPALAMLPTETKYCKPSLLPHNELKLYGQGDKQDMAVDNHILDTTEKRSDHLQRYRDGAICVPFETVAEYNQDKNREIFKHSLVYIFHDVIDKTGHDGNAKQVTQACREAITELDTMIPKIHASYNVTEVYVTSDHGFLFNDIAFAEKDKHKIEEDTLERSSRYYLTTSEKEVNGIIKFPLDEVSAMVNVGDVFVAVPQGTNRLAAPSGGYMFTHGGAAMQELIIPVITSRQERADNKQPVGVMVLDRKLSMQASRLRFKLLQTEAVSMDMKERIVNVALYYNDEAVTPVKTIPLDKTDPSLDNRKIQVDLTLNRNVDAKVLQLKVFDVTDELNPLIKENVTNNTLIENDFDF
ncbi:BREX-1 system phosphatase PglZ type A [Prevotella histicola]|uniref:BREX-1 system phosphatase PglZ type A n=1 Tax=Prevotella histicola TaxID=470565 RepID=UPI0028E87317|nr:BREX-1 system phosphatase PglZ type A [Prevotella histicola]